EAARQGRTAVVVTIDPAKRLANTLGLDTLSNTANEIDRRWWDPDGKAPSLEEVARDAGVADVFVRPQEAADLAAAAAFRSDRHSLQQEQADRLAQRLPLPQIHLPFLYTADIGPAEVETLADVFVTEVGALPEPVST
ncbi:MAG TPA: hypothetical protein VMQ81_12770, partial [Acidimicrobiia bacterium]|nr:hypothetical protein [Acidimicrobiia bacterium]